MYNHFLRCQRIHTVKYLFHFVAILTLQLSSCHRVIASSANQGYVPPTDQKSNSNQRRHASGSRGCRVGENFISIDLLDHKDADLNIQTNKSTVVFNISNIPKDPVIITLTQPNKIEPLFETEININRSGIWKINTNIEDYLLEDRRYVLTILLACNNFNPSQNIYVRSLY